jgi:hypothetical protein
MPAVELFVAIPRYSSCCKVQQVPHGHLPWAGGSQISFLSFFHLEKTTGRKETADDLNTVMTTNSPAPRIRFDRNELAGAFGDMGTDVPLIVGMVLAAGLDAASVLVMFGVMQIMSGAFYRLPMPVQPLKAMATLVIAQQATAATLYGAGIAIGVSMLLLTLTGGLDWLAKVVPKCVIRGIQLGLGLQLASVALGKFVPSDGLNGYILAVVAFGVIVTLLGNRRVPAALIVVLLGAAYAFLVSVDSSSLAGSVAFRLPSFHAPSMSDVLTGFVVLAMPQIPLSLGNSVLATRQLAEDLFPNRNVTIRKIGLTYSLMNLVSPWFGGVPTCHGSGGMAGHVAFGGRTGGSVILYGGMFLMLGLFFGGGFEHVIRVFPLPMLGVILLFEALALMWLIRDTASSATDLPIALIVGLLAAGMPYGYVVGIVVGVILYQFRHRTRLVARDPHPQE